MQPSATGLPASLLGHVVERIPTTRRVVALTFDGGSGAEGAPSILATLRGAGVPASFFLTGRFAQANPQLARTMAAYGPVGDHTLTHPHLTELTAEGVRTEVMRGAAAVESVTGRDTIPWFRFPYGEYDGRTLAIVNGFGYAAIGWSAASPGWQGRAEAGSADAVVDRVVSQVQPGAIVLMHLGAAPDGSTLDADALPALIGRLRALGYGFVSLEALRQ